MLIRDCIKKHLKKSNVKQNRNYCWDRNVYPSCIDSTDFVLLLTSRNCNCDHVIQSSTGRKLIPIWRWPPSWIFKLAITFTHSKLDLSSSGFDLWQFTPDIQWNNVNNFRSNLWKFMPDIHWNNVNSFRCNLICGSSRQTYNEITSITFTLIWFVTVHARHKMK